MKKIEKRSGIRNRQLLFIPVFVIFLLFTFFFIYVQQYCHADQEAYSALNSDDIVTVTTTEYGWLFDGPGEDDALIFYPGGKVEEVSYAPLLHLLAQEGMDVCLVKMPFRLAVFDMNKADQVIKQHDYVHWYIGGHSLGGTIAANYTASHNLKLSGVFMLAAYPSEVMDENIKAIIIYGSEDGILNMERLKEADQYLPLDTRTFVIDGGNHSQFGNYGKQDRDKDALISSADQQRQTVELILHNR